MSKKTLQEPNQMATSEEEIAAIFGVQAGDALVIKAEGIVIVIQNGKIMWKSEGLEVTPELIAKIMAYALSTGAVKALMQQLKGKRERELSPPASGKPNASSKPVISR